MTDPVPSKDLVSRLRSLAAIPVFGADHIETAADEIERLNAALTFAAQEAAREAGTRAAILAENEHYKQEAARWQTYLKCYDREEMVAAEWDGPAAITAFIDSMRATQPPGAGQ